MITNNQLRSLSDEELGYLVMCLNTEWRALNMSYELNMNLIKAFKNDAVVLLLNKYSSNLKDEYRNIPNEIINKLNENR